MSDPDELPKLRLAPVGTPEQLARHLERERRIENQHREDNLEESLEGYRVGTVPYLNGAPLIRGIEREVLSATPSRLAEMLRRDELDAALVSVTEVLFNDRYEVLDGVAIASLGEVKSVHLAHRRPLEEATEVFCDPASLTSVNLLRVLLAERGLSPAFKTLPSYDFAALPDFALLIGDIALDFARGSRVHEIWDLGTAWYELTQLPFVYAVWAIRRGLDTTRLRRVLREAKDFGVDTLDHIIRTRTEYDFEFRSDYLGWHIHFHLGSDEKRGISRFIELLRKHGLGPVFEPRFVA
jgi:chorismate dehydratase